MYREWVSVFFCLFCLLFGESLLLFIYMSNIVTTQKKELETMIKNSVREVLEQELIKFRGLLAPFVSEKEQKDIEDRYGEPSRKTAKSVKVKI